MIKNLKVVFTILFIIGIIGAFPIIQNKSKIELGNDTYQIALGFSSINNIREDIDRNKLYNELKNIGINTIAFGNQSISELLEFRDIKYFTVEEYLQKESKIIGLDKLIDKYTPEDTFIVMLSKNDFLENEIGLIKEYFKNYQIIEEDEDIYIYVDEPAVIEYKDEKIVNELLTKKFFINEKYIKEVYEKGFKLALRIENVEGNELQNYIYNEIKYLNEKYEVDKVQFGKEVIGMPSNVDKFVELFKEENICAISTEFDTKSGLSKFSNNGQSLLIRGHQIDVNALNLSDSEFASRVSRAVKERNMRYILLSNFIDYRSNSQIKNSLNDVIQDIKLSKDYLKNYNLGYAKPFDDMDIYNKEEIFTALSIASLFSMLLLSLFDKNYVMSLVLFITCFIGFGFVSKLEINILTKIYALLTAVIGAFSAIVIPKNSNIKSFTTKFLMSCFIALSSGILVSSIMYGTDYMLKLSEFSGIKVLYILPPLLTGIWVLIDSKMLNSFNIKKINKNDVLRFIKSIKISHIVLVGLILIGVFIYIKRSGNSGSISDVELAFRNTLEEILYVRPRTKEFLLGYPAILIAFYMYKKNIKYAPFMLILGSIGTMSTVNTFTHLHTPVFYSILRSIYGFLFGAIIGFLVIFVISKLEKTYLRR